jgi:hypothetical protein
MCDCYNHKCEYCDNYLSIHIADFCVARDIVKVVCPVCLSKINPDGLLTKKVFWDTIQDDHQICVGPNEESVVDDGDTNFVGQTVLFLCDDEKAYGIHLN